MARPARPEPHHPPFPEGVLIIDKPSGPTSHDIVALARRVTGISKIGHLGTLDPLAQGVLPLVLGRATRLAQFLSGADKEYEAHVRLGATTNTYDSTGIMVSVPSVTPPAVSRAAVERALNTYRGTYLQTPPAFSAKKVLGTTAYRLARANRPVELTPVQVTVHALELISHDQDRVRLRVVCSAGFYVRSLAHAIGQDLGTGAYLEALIRRRSGAFGLEDAMAPLALERDPGAAAARVIPPPRLLEAFPSLVLTAEGAQRASRGQLIGKGDVSSAWISGEADHVRLLHPDGRLVAIARRQDPSGLLHPGVVLE